MKKLGVFCVIVAALFTNGAAFGPPDPSSENPQWVYVDGKTLPWRADGRYVIDGVPTLVLTGEKELKEAAVSYLPRIDFSGLIKPGKLSARQRDQRFPAQKSLGENAGELASKLGKNPLAAYNPKNAAQFGETLRQTTKQMEDRKKQLDQLMQ